LNEALASTVYGVELATSLALNVPVLAMPVVLVTTVVVVAPDPKFTVAPLVGPVNFTVTPDTGFPNRSTTFATRGFVKGDPLVVCCGEPDTYSMAWGVLAVTVAVAVAGVVAFPGAQAVVPAGPQFVLVASIVYVPAPVAPNEK
jgi:hypothetical protein